MCTYREHLRRGLILLGLLGGSIIAPPVSAQSPARQGGYLYLSPVPAASYVSAQTRYLLIRFAQITPLQVTNLTTDFIAVTGAYSGAHPGSVRVASDGRTVMFTMGVGFDPGELVTVTLNPELAPGAGGSAQSYQYQFMVTAPMPGSFPHHVSGTKVSLNQQAMSVGSKAITQNSSNSLPRAASSKALLMSNGVSVPSDFPQIVVTVNSNPSPGYLFLENGLDNFAAPYTMMVDNNGLPVWYRRGRMYDFKIQKNGQITWCLSDDTGFPAFDQNFNYLKTYLTTNGYQTDGHELKVMADGTYFMIGYQTNTVDMSQYVNGGIPSIVRETVVQEFTSQDDLIFQWRAWDNYDLADENGNTDFPHMNGIDIDDDGNILVSARHLSEVTKVDRNSGDIIWRLSGAHSSFSFLNDPLNGTSFQHNISALGNGHYMVFDNGNYHVAPVSRAVEYQLDLTNMTATMAWQFRDNPDKYTYWLGSAQRLTSGNTLINFVLPDYPKAIEVDTNGLKHFELTLVPNSDSYRAFRFPWNGVGAAPYLVVEPQVDNVTLIFNKFGDTNVAYYKIYGGLTPSPTTLLDESTTTLKKIYNLPEGQYYFHVSAVSTQGVESPISNEETAFVNTFASGVNMLQNGAFVLGGYDWGFNLSSTAIATWNVANQVARFFITNGAASLANVQLSQGGLPIMQGKLYALDFDAWASQSRYIQVRVSENAAPFLDYSQVNPSFLTPNPTHFHYVFTVQQASDFSSVLQFDMGAGSGTVYLANISLINPAVGDLNADGRVDYLDLGIFTGNWLQRASSLPGDLNIDGKVDFTDFSLMGKSWTGGLP